MSMIIKLIWANFQCWVMVSSTDILASSKLKESSRTLCRSGKDANLDICASKYADTKGELRNRKVMLWSPRKGVSSRTTTTMSRCPSPKRPRWDLSSYLRTAAFEVVNGPILTTQGITPFLSELCS